MVNRFTPSSSTAWAGALLLAIVCAAAQSLWAQASDKPSQDRKRAEQKGQSTAPDKPHESPSAAEQRRREQAQQKGAEASRSAAERQTDPARPEQAQSQTHQPSPMHQQSQAQSHAHQQSQADPAHAQQPGTYPQQPQGPMGQQNQQQAQTQYGQPGQTAQGFQQGYQGQQTFQPGPGQPGGAQQNRGWLGVMLMQGPSNQGRGVAITRVYPSSPAARAGLRPGDILLKIDDQQVSSHDQVIQTVQRFEPNREVRLVVLRDGQEQTINANLASRMDSDVAWQQGGPWQGGSWQSGQYPPQQYWQGRPPEAGGDFYPGQFQGVPEHAMRMEQERCMAEQNERIEGALNQLREEVRQLRQELIATRGQSSTGQQHTAHRFDSQTQPVPSSTPMNRQPGSSTNPGNTSPEQSGSMDIPGQDNQD